MKINNKVHLFNKNDANTWINLNEILKSISSSDMIKSYPVLGKLKNKKITSDKAKTITHKDGSLTMHHILDKDSPDQ